MNIRIIDTTGINHTLDFDFRKIESKNLYGNVIAEIKKIVKSEFEKIEELVNNSENLLIKISLEPESNNETATKLASFNVALSSETEYLFNIYYSTTKEIANRILKIESKEKHNLENIILHEFIHALDLFTLKETYLIETNDIELTKKAGVFDSTKINLNLYNNNVQWAFLNYFTAFRNEGIAILGEKLLGTTSSDFDENDIENLLLLFRHDINEVLNMSSDLHFYNELEKNKVYEKLNTIYLSAYQYADLILIILIAKLNPELAEICNKAQDYILGKSKNELTKNDIHNLLKIAIDIDISEFINGILRHPFFDENQSLISIKQLFQCCAIIQDDENLDGISLFAKTIGVIGYNQSQESFIETMKASVGSCMSIEEINDLHSKFIEKKYTEDIVISLKIMAQELYNLSVSKNNETARWALTYLLDDEDLVHDNISIIGWQDDWLVLNAALNIINK